MGSQGVKDVWSKNMMTDYKEQYLLYCKDLNNCFTKEDVRKHNAAMKNLSKLFYMLKTETERSFLSELLQSENKRTRALVAAHCLGLGIYMTEAEKILKLIAKDKSDPFLAFEAQSTLDVWKQQGYLDF